ncbi:uncharacterized protein VTP21DRAFT_2049 [Calcarisporiella thermophila]|uniref:uncharacterized protein n=1 Tax=Calcarisporiella thermophila TaxID=911321 RepID=UPI0037440124
MMKGLFYLIFTILPSFSLAQQSQIPMAGEGTIWSLCDNPGTHLLKARNVSIVPEQPRVGSDISVTINGDLSDDVSAGNVLLDLKLYVIKLRKELDLCQVLDSEIMSGASCPIKAGPVTLRAEAHIPEEVPKLPLKGDISILDKGGRTLTCVHLDFQLQ